MKAFKDFMLVLFSVVLFFHSTYAENLMVNPMVSVSPILPQTVEKASVQNVIIQSDSQKKDEQEVAKKPRTKEQPSSFEKFVAESNLHLVQFGYEFFHEPTNFVVEQKSVVNPDYILGPGDEIKISVWGKIDANWTVTVDRDGNIYIPKIGALGVVGLTYSELKQLLFNEISKYFSGFQMNVSMGSLKNIRIYVLGNAYKPGTYFISSLSTLVNAIFDTGGPAKNGSMRNIKLIRNGKIFKDFDLYDFLLKGDKSNDARLMPEDVIFYPVIGPLVAIGGNIKKPAIFELKSEKSLKDLVELTGGLNEETFKGRVQVERISDGFKQFVFEDSVESALTKEIVGGDIIRFFGVYPDKRTVRITGAIQRPGEYGYSNKMRITELLSLSGGLKYYAYEELAELTRVTITNSGPKTEKITINLEKALANDPNHNIELKQDDYLFVRAVPEWDLYKQVTIKGEVKFPGVYTIKKGEKLSSLIERAGGFTDKAYIEGAIFIRQRVKELQQKSLNEMVERLERELLSTGTAEVAVALSPEEAKVKEAEIKQKRDFVNRLRNVTALGRVSIKIDEPQKLKNTHYDIELEDNDIIEVPANPKTVFVVGSVYNQTAFVYNEDEGVDYYLKLAGGTTENANESSIYILKANGTAERVKKGIFGFGEISKITPGDTIVVPEKLERIAWMKNIKDITQILYQIAVTAGVLIVAF